MNTKKGNLYLIPGPLGEGDAAQVLPDYNFQIIRKLKVFVVEELRTARRFLRKCGYTGNFEELTFFVLNEHTPESEIPGYFVPALEGADTGLVSEAGCPAVADPGSGLVRIAHEYGIKVIPLSGPSSIMMALMSSGFNGQQFIFHGYIPVKEHERAIKLKEISRDAQKTGQTHIFIEAPYRNRQMIESIIKNCPDYLLLSIACNLTMPDEEINTLPVSIWKKRNYNPGKKPAVFLLSI
ncbi:MAG: SAM-dependent methyltransferase [Lentimicrobium sp.]|nr:SAM-dependent methyltransferase [Lentimicrobium sp.]